MERHGGHLERQPREHEHQPEQQAGIAARRIGRGDVAEDRRAAEPVNQADAIKQDARRQRSENEIFQPRLCRTHIAPHEARQHIGGQALQLQPDIERQQVVRRDHHPHARRGEQDQHRIFRAQIVTAGAREKARGDDDRNGRGKEDQRLGKGGEQIGAIQAVKRRAARRSGAGKRDARTDQHRDRRPADRARNCGATPGGNHQQREAADRDDNLGQHHRKLCGVIHQCAAPCSAGCLAESWPVACAAAAGLPGVGRLSPAGRARSIRASRVATSPRIGARKLSG